MKQLQDHEDHKIVQVNMSKVVMEEHSVQSHCLVKHL